ncbi:MAG: HAD family hydrolase [Acidimicrobiales bacterium]
MDNPDRAGGGAPLAAILDYGGVMAVSPLSRIHWLAEELGASRDVVVSTIFSGHGDGVDNPWMDAEVGACEMDEEFGARMQARFDPHDVVFDLDFFRSWVVDATNEPEPQMVAAVRQLRTAGVRSVLLTNSVKGFRGVIDATVPVDELFDEVLESWQIGSRKPEARAYWVAADRLGVPASRCVFVDDLPVNVDAATALGMTAILMEDGATASSKLLEVFGL